MTLVEIYTEIKRLKDLAFKMELDDLKKELKL